MVNHFRNDEVFRFLEPNVKCHLPVRSDGSSPRCSSAIWCTFLHSSSTFGLYVVVLLRYKRSGEKSLKNLVSIIDLIGRYLKSRRFVYKPLLCCVTIYTIPRRVRTAVATRGTVSGMIPFSSCHETGKLKGQEDVRFYDFPELEVLTDFLLRRK